LIFDTFYSISDKIMRQSSGWLNRIATGHETISLRYSRSNKMNFSRKKSCFPDMRP